jgi:hypothetical protein
VGFRCRRYVARLSKEALIYRSATAYALGMRVLYGRYYAGRDAAVAAHVPDGATVLELCCGPARLFREELQGRIGAYVALDASAHFVGRLRAQGVDARRCDVATTPLPGADVVLMQASLYHFLPDALAMVDRMRAAAGERVVLCEPVVNLATSDVPVLSRLAARGTATHDGAQAERFDEAALEALLAGVPVRHAEPVAGGREQLYVLEPAA